ITMNKTVQDAMIATDRLFEILDLEREKDSSDLELTKENIGDIQIKNVSFRYGTRDNVFDELSLTIPKAKFTAIVGESGSGKSTLISILQNLYPVQSGTITIGKYDLKHIKNTYLR